jgi:hypothetical protein
LNAFLDDFPTVTRDMAIAALERAKAHLIANASGFPPELRRGWNATA